jgi:hypothetical protein
METWLEYSPRQFLLALRNEQLQAYLILKYIVHLLQENTSTECLDANVSSPHNMTMGQAYTAANEHLGRIEDTLKIIEKYTHRNP